MRQKIKKGWVKPILIVLSRRMEVAEYILSGCKGRDLGPNDGWGGCRGPMTRGGWCPRDRCFLTVLS